MIIYQVYPKTPIFVRKQLKLNMYKFTQFDSSSFLITANVEKKTFLYSGPSKIRINDQKFKEKIAED